MSAIGEIFMQYRLFLLIFKGQLFFLAWTASCFLKCSLNVDTPKYIRQINVRHVLTIHISCICLPYRFLYDFIAFPVAHL